MLILDQLALARIAQLRARAEATPMAPFDVRSRLRQRQINRVVPDPPEHTVAIAEGYLVAFQIEDWPDGLWRRLTISSIGDVWDGLHMLLKEFGFVGGNLEQVRWWGPARGGRHVFTIGEMMRPRDGAPVTGETADQMIVDDPVDYADPEEEDPEE